MRAVSLTLTIRKLDDFARNKKKKKNDGNIVNGDDQIAVVYFISDKFWQMSL